MKHNLSILCAFVIMVLAGAACLPAPAACLDILTVTTTLDANDGACTADHCSLRDAVIAANACAGHQTINVPAGGYSLTLLGAEEDLAATGDLDITEDVTILGEGVPSIDGVTKDRIFEIFSPAVVEIDHFILINGLAQLGGAIRSQGELTVTNSSIHNNSAEVPPGGSGASSGGGIFVEAGTTSLINTQLFENFADYGGGVHNFATATFNMTGGLLAMNEASGWGGGLWNNMASTANLEDVEIARNTTAERGAGIYNNGTLEANRITLNENVSDGDGGGVYNDENGEMYLTLAWFTNNNAQFGGALYNRGLLHLYQSSLTINSALGGLGGGAYNDGVDAALLMQNTTVSGNMIVPFAAPGGSGIYNNSGDLRLEFVTMAYNNADGVNNNGGHVAFRSSILAYHSLGNCAGDAGDSQGYNLETGNTCGLIEPTDLVDTNPILEWLAMNGGVNLNHALNPASPAIDSGDPDRCIEIDQRGVTRPQGLGCDRGAYEAEMGEATPVSAPMALALENANCRKGQGTEFESMAMLIQGQSYEINGRTVFEDWWRVVLPNGLFCWVSDTKVDVTGPTADISVIETIATDTPTPVVGCWVGKRCTVPCPPNTYPVTSCTP
jgi:CSLREA domain-containing protein